MKNITILILALTPFLCFGQEIDFEKFEALRFRNIGPAGMSGRITAIDVNLRDKDHIYVGAASGGVWESKNGGINWKPIFDEQPTQCIGAIEINQANPAEIWVGTGEGNPRNSHNSGAGVFKSVDAGKTWKSMGLEKTKLIHRVIVNTSNTNSVLVGAMGSAWGPRKTEVYTELKMVERLGRRPCMLEITSVLQIWLLILLIPIRFLLLCGNLAVRLGDLILVEKALACISVMMAVILGRNLLRKKVCLRVT